MTLLAPAIADRGDDGQRFRQRISGETVAAPDLLRLEVTSVLRRHLASGALAERQAEAATIDLIDLPIRVPNRPPAAQHLAGPPQPLRL